MKLAIPTALVMEHSAERCAAQCEDGCRIFLRGELGAGKTTFARGFLRGLGHRGQVKSPTYTLVEPYELAQFPVYHFDLYRLNEPLELEAIGGRDYFDGQGVCLVEWPEKAAAYLGQPDLMVDIRYLANGRELFLQPCSGLGKRMLAGLDGWPG